MSTAAPDTAAGSSISGALRALGLSSLALTLPLETVPFLRTLHAEAPSTDPGLALLMMSQLGALFFLLLRRPVRRIEWLLFLMMIGGMAQVMLASPGSSAADLLIPGYWLFPIITVALRTQHRREYLAFGLGSALAAMGLNWYLLDEQNWEDIADLLWIAQPTAEVILFGTALIAISQAKDRAVARRHAAQLQHSEEENRLGAAREAARLLHDHILHALLAISHGGEAQATQRDCRVALDALEMHGRSSGNIQVEELISQDPTLSEVGAQLIGTSKPVAMGVATAVAAATHEALRNVQRHSEASGCRVLVETHDNTLHVLITDNGSGFDPARHRVDRLGVGSSIVHRMDDAGGHAVIRSRPGRGTSVHLSWPRHDSHADEPLWEQAPRRLVRNGLTRTAWPGLVTGMLMTLLVGSQTARCDVQPGCSVW